MPYQDWDMDTTWCPIVRPKRTTSGFDASANRESASLPSIRDLVNVGCCRVRTLYGAGDIEFL